MQNEIAAALETINAQMRAKLDPPVAVSAENTAAQPANGAPPVQQGTETRGEVQDGGRGGGGGRPSLLADAAASVVGASLALAAAVCALQLIAS